MDGIYSWSLFADGICGLNGSWLTGGAGGIIIGAVLTVVVERLPMDGTSGLEGGWSSGGADGLTFGAKLLMVVVWLFSSDGTSERGDPADWR